MKDKTSLIFNIQRYALHDGPGIRTTVFFKGCPLRCKWCHNPESIALEEERTFSEKKCIKCDSCEEFALPENCPTNALETIGHYYTADDLFKEIKKDVLFFDQSGGGVTFSGGEPLIHHEFLLEILKKCKDMGMHTAIDTSGFSTWDNIDKLRKYVDIFLYDIKTLDSSQHKELTGVSNEVILENLKKLSETNVIYLRVPVIKGINDDEININHLCDLAIDYKIEKIYFLPYHNYSENKYKNLKSDIEFVEYDRPLDERMNEIIKMCTSRGIEAYIGG